MAYTVWLREDQIVLSFIDQGLTFMNSNRSCTLYVVTMPILQHPIPNDDLVEFVLAGLGPFFHPFTRSLESRQKDITFDALYELLLDGSRHTPSPQSKTVGESNLNNTYASLMNYNPTKLTKTILKPIQLIHGEPTI
ncbi:hypothetical protein H5410_022184 [Solanum commersonii]|uniref:Uncharacterized protein n=1 Tax=Solanum commersonii TaxID=4109 RepID=A0A9J5ZG14_SOLCO|nr:hypothetical protein H5410_022184 [Solanum commersonii]